MPEHSHKTRFPEKRLLKPSEFMYARHPELFSDTPPLKVPVLEKSHLEYHLETLTSRKQEQVFEEFCRRLAELEICLNLKPQTGPTGGGDSKTDTSTYPVAPVRARELRRRDFKPEVVEKFLRERMRHFDFDLPHNPLFGEPPGDWPRI